MGQFFVVLTVKPTLYLRVVDGVPTTTLFKDDATRFPTEKEADRAADRHWRKLMRNEPLYEAAEAGQRGL